MIHHFLQKSICFWHQLIQLMFPVLWSYILSQYMRVFLLSLFGFLAILFSARLDDIAKFIAFGSDWETTALFILHQIPYILPIAIPVSSLIASFFLYHNLSVNNELTAMRTSGMTFKEVLLPVMLLASFLAIGTFLFVLDLGSKSHLSSKELEYDIKSSNPLALIQHAQFLRYHGIDLDMRGSLQPGEVCKDVILTMRHGENKRCLIVLAKRVDITSNELKFNSLNILSTVGSTQESEYDHLMVENIQDSTISVQDLAHLIHKKPWKVANDQLEMSLLAARKKDQHNKMIHNHSSGRKKHFQHQIRKCNSEIARRFSLALSVLTFSILGATYGISIGRIQKSHRFTKAMFLAAFFLGCYMAAKAMDHSPLAAITLFSLPHWIIYILTYKKLQLLYQGIE